VNGSRLWDIFLLPGRYFQRITDRRATLYLGVLLIGVVDLLFPFTDLHSRYFSGRTDMGVIKNVILLIVFTVLLGFVDVLFFSLPVFDILKFIKRKQKWNPGNGLLIRVMKVYISAHFIIIPLQLIAYYLEKKANIRADQSLALQFVLYLGVLFSLWFSAIITRGLITLFQFDARFRMVIFIVVYFWNDLLGVAFNYIEKNWVTLLLK
jgi:hypothetical protein